MYRAPLFAVSCGAQKWDKNRAYRIQYVCFPPWNEFTYLQPEWVSNEKQTKRIPVVVVVVVVDVSGFLVCWAPYIFPREYV